MLGLPSAHSRSRTKWCFVRCGSSCLAARFWMRLAFLPRESLLPCCALWRRIASRRYLLPADCNLPGLLAHICGAFVESILGFARLLIVGGKLFSQPAAKFRQQIRHRGINGVSAGTPRSRARASPFPRVYGRFSASLRVSGEFRLPILVFFFGVLGFAMRAAMPHPRTSRDATRLPRPRDVRMPRHLPLHR